MRILVTGAYGLIGSACLSRLHRDGHALVGVGRAVETAKRSFPYVRWIEADVALLVDVHAWRPLLSGIDAVVNCVGVLQDGARDDIRRVHVSATCALFDACAQAGIQRVVHVSAIGAEPAGPTRSRPQGGGRRALVDARSRLGDPAAGAGVFAHGLRWHCHAARPRRGSAADPADGTDSHIQVVSVDDVAETVAFSLTPAAPAKVRWELAHPQAHALVDIVLAMRGWLGWRPRPLVPLPLWSQRLVTAAADTLGWLGWRSPARSTALAQLAVGVEGEPATWIAATGIKPQSLADILAAHPAGVQERWFSKLYLLKPVAIGTLALFWFATGVIALGPGRAPSLAHLHAAGVEPPLDQVILVGGAIFDIVLGLLLLWRPATRAVLIIMLVVTPFYVLTGTLLEPELWADPLGPLTKIGPLMVATLFTLVILDER